MSETCLGKMVPSNLASQRRPLNKSPYVATTPEAVANYEANETCCWYKSSADPDDPTGKYAFQRLRHTWFTPKVDPKFKLRRTINSTPSAHVSRAALKKPWYIATWIIFQATKSCKTPIAWLCGRTIPNTSEAPECSILWSYFCELTSSKLGDT